MAQIAKISRLHYLTHDDVLGMDHAHLAGLACRAGIQWIQFRSKNLKNGDLHQAAQQVREVTMKYGATLIINDHVDLALAIQADGIHLGKEDMAPEAARKILGSDFIIGGTANTREDIQRLMNAGVDYIGLGPYRFTETKKNLSPVIDKASLYDLINFQQKIPVILIGGIRRTDIGEIRLSGAHGLAVSSAITQAADPETEGRLFLDETLNYFNE